MKKKAVLISAVGGSFFPYVIDLLKNSYQLILTDVSKEVLRIYPEEEVVVVPRADSAEFQSAVKKLIAKHGVEYYIPLVDQEISKVLAIADEIKRLKVISPNLEFVDLCLDKYRLMETLSKCDISRVKTYLERDFRAGFGWPVFVKPIISAGSRGARKLADADQLEAYFQLERYGRDEVMIQEYLEGEEYSVSVVVNNLNRLIAIVPKKIIQKKGITQHAVVERNGEIEKVCKEVVEELKPGGPFNVQLKVVDQRVRIFEINPRFSTTSILTCEAGVNEFGLCMESWGQRNVKYADSYREGLHLLRRWESVFYDGQ